MLQNALGKARSVATFGTLRKLGVLALALISCAAFLAAEPNLDSLLADNGFSRIANRKIPPFSIKSLEGTAISESFFADRPSLILVFKGKAPVEIQAMAGAPAAIGILAISSDSPNAVRSAFSKPVANLVVCADAAPAIRALGGPGSPSWLLVSPGGNLFAAKSGRLMPETLVAIVKAIIKSGPATSSTPPPGAAPTGTPAPAGAKAPPTAAPAPALPASPAKASVSNDAAYLSAVERELVAELNLARTQPSAYVEILRDYRRFINGNRLEKPGEITVILDEGAKAVDEAIAALVKQAPLEPFTASKGLSRAARDHAEEQGPSGATGHSGKDGSSSSSRVERYGKWLSTMGENISYGASTAREIVIQLIVDDGVPSRGHRKNIYTPNFLAIGVAVAPHSGYGTVAVMDFAGGFEEK